ncbi:MAG: hypothetical protein U0794_05315 [Isosphaeraceae bacterium]
MRGLKPSVALATLTLLGLTLWVSANYDTTGSQMATAARQVLTAARPGTARQGDVSV